MVSLRVNGCGRHLISKSPHKDSNTNVGVCLTGKEKVKESPKLLCLQHEPAAQNWIQECCSAEQQKRQICDYDLSERRKQANNLIPCWNECVVTCWSRGHSKGSSSCSFFLFHFSCQRIDKVFFFIPLSVSIVAIETLVLSKTLSECSNVLVAFVTRDLLLPSIGPSHMSRSVGLLVRFGLKLSLNWSGVFISFPMSCLCIGGFSDSQHGWPVLLQPGGSAWISFLQSGYYTP